MATDSGVKSARRVFEFLEYMAKVERKVSVAEIANHYGHPNSSVSSVMRTMVSLGYLSYDARDRTYLPTVRLPFLIQWVGTKLFHHGRLRGLLQDLSRATGETILLGAQSRLQVQYVEVIEATGPMRLHADPGFRPMARTAIGLIFLSRYSDAKATSLIRRINADEPDPAKHIDVPEVMAKVAQVREQGWAVSVNSMVPGGGAVAIFIPDEMNGNPLGVAIASSEARVLANAQQWVGLMHDAVARNYENAMA